MGPASRSYVSEAVTPERLGTAMGLWWATLFLGRTFGSILGGSIAEVWTYEYVFYACSVSAFIGAVLAFVGVRKKPGLQEKRDNSASEEAARKNNVPVRLSNTLISMGLSRPVGILFILALITMVGNSLVIYFLPIFAAEQLKATIFEVGILMAIFSGVFIIVTPLVGSISDKIGRKPLIVVGVGLFGLTVMGYAISSSVYHLALVTVGVGASLSIVTPCTLALLTEIVPSNRYGVMMGLYGTFEDLGMVVAPLLYSYVWSALSPTSIFYACAVIHMFGVVLSLNLKKISH